MSEPQNQKNPAGDFPHWQSSLIAKTGLTDDEFRALRTSVCVRDVHFRVGRLNHIEFTDDGARIMLAAAVKNAAPAAAVAQQDAAAHGEETCAPAEQLTPGAPFPAQQDVPLIVEKIWPVNPQCLSAKTAAGLTVTVRVRNNRAFRPGMAITARHVAGDIYAISSKHRPSV